MRDSAVYSSLLHNISPGFGFGITRTPTGAYTLAHKAHPYVPEPGPERAYREIHLEQYTGSGIGDQGVYPTVGSTLGSGAFPLEIHSLW
jgi:hypothetical protein